jgi:nitroreductase
MDFLTLAKKRFSARSYLNKKVSQKDLDYLLEAARIAPSASNRQPWKFIVVQKEENLKEIHKLYHREWFSEAPCAILILGDHSQSWKRAQDHKDHTDIDVSIAIDHFTLAATERGLASCWICNFYVKETIQYFDLPDHLEPIAFLSLGYPTKEAKPNRHQKQRKPLEEIVFYEKLS